MYKRYHPDYKELEDMRLCHQHNLAYVIVPKPNTNKYWISKYAIDDFSQVYFLPKDKTRLATIDNREEFIQYEAEKKIMELYSFHAKRLTK